MSDEQGDLFSYNGGRPPRKTRADQIEADFKTYHRANPIVYERVEVQAFDAISKGFKHYSISECIEVVRWWYRDNIRSESGLKIRNDFRAYYARMFHVAHPEHSGFFRTRKRPSTDKPQFPGDPPPSIDPPEIPPDKDLDKRLKDLLDETNEPF